MSPVLYEKGRAVCRVDALRLGQHVDLQNDAVADPGEDCADGRFPEWGFEFDPVIAIEHEGPDCIRLDFESGFSCGFPPDHKVEVDGEQTPEELDAAEAELSGT